MSLILTGSGSGGGGNVLPGYVTYDAVLPDPLAGVINDFAPPGRIGANAIILTANAPFTLTGIAGGTPNQHLLLINASAFTGTITGTSGTAVNQFASSLSLLAGTGVFLVYNALLSQWVPLSANAGGGGGGSPGGPNHSVQFSNAGVFAGNANFLFNPGNNTLTLTGNFLLAGGEQQSGIQSTVLAAGNNNDLLVTASVRILRLTGDVAGSNVTGITHTNNMRVTLINVDATTVVLPNASGASSAGNTFLCPGGADFQLIAGGNCDIWYDVISSAWRVLA